MVKAALRNPHAVIVLALAILVIGLTAIVKLPTDILPTFKTRNLVCGLGTHARLRTRRLDRQS